MIEANKVNELLEFYKNRLTENGGLKGCDEIFKWESLTKYQGRPNLSAVDLGKEFKEIKFDRLVYHIAGAVMKELSTAAPNEYREILKELFNDDKDLTQRIQEFTTNSTKLYKGLKSDVKHSSYHDERTAATLLTYHNPLNYTFFKPTLYKTVCKMLNLEAKKNGRYQHFLKILNELVPSIKKDNELMAILDKETKNYIQSDLLLGQDMLYQASYAMNIFYLSVKDGVYHCDVDVSIDEWKEILQDPFIMKGSLQKYLIQFYVSPEHKSTCTDVSAYFNESPQSVNGTITAFCKAVKKMLDRFTVIGLDGKQTYWPIAMNGRDLGNGYFEWQLRNNLIKAMEELKITSQNSQLIEDTVQASNIIDPVVSLLKKKKQIILQGAPGTGKTYKTAEIAVGICNPSFKWDSREQLMKEYARLKSLGQISFTTFHQSMDYEEFIEGLKPVKDSNPIRFEPHPGLFKEVSDEALLSNIKLTKESYSSLEYDEVYDNMLNDIEQGKLKEIETRTGTLIYLSATQQNNIQFNYSDKLKKYIISKERLRKLYTTYDELEKVDAIQNINDEVRTIIGGCDTSGYWAALKYIVSHTQAINDTDIDIANMSEKEQHNITQDFLATSKEQRSLVDNVPNYVLIIDEINRGNISKILGELITLLESDKRIGECNEIVAKLPYSHTLFGVPSNLYIIGTMNTADRSVGYIDYAIRRRFAFVSINSDRTIIESFYKEDKLKNDAVELFDNVRELIYQYISFEFNADDLMIGHSYFMTKTKEDLLDSLEYSIKPLLREYANDGILSIERDKTGRHILIEELHID